MSILLLDLDRTLFNSPHFLNDYIKPALAQAIGAAVADIETVGNAYWQSLPKYTDFNPDEYVTYIATHFNVAVEPLAAIITNPEFYQLSLFPETVKVLEELSQNYQLGIFSEGNEVFQNRKIDLSGLRAFLRPDLLFIKKRKLEPKVLAELPTCWIVDDNPEVIEALGAVPTIKPIWIKRDNTLVVPPALAAVPTISSLTELPAVLQAN